MVVQLGLAMMPCPAAMTAAASCGLTSETTSGIVRVLAEGAGVVDHDHARVGELLRERPRGRRTRGEQRDVEAARVGGGGVLDGDLAGPAYGSTVPAERGRGEEPDVADREAALLQDLAHRDADLAGGADDADVEGASCSSAGASVDDRLDLVGVEVEGGVGGADGVVDLALVHDHRDPDLGGGDHLDVDPGRGERREELGGDARGASACRRRSARPCRSGRRRAASRSRPRPGSWRARAIAVLPSARGSVKEMSVRPVAAAETFWTTMSRLTSTAASASKMRAASPTLSGYADHGDLGLAPVVGDAGDDGLFHGSPPSRVGDRSTVPSFCRRRSGRGPACRSGGRTRRTAGAGSWRRDAAISSISS